MASHAEQLDRPAGPASSDNPVQHETASVFVIAYVDGEWRVLLIWHARLGALTIPGGHAENGKKGRGETAAETAFRETREESGYEIILLSPPAPRFPEEFPHQILPRPWLIVSGHASADSVASGPHVHIDHQFIALVTGAPHPDRESEPLWFSAAELAEREDCLPDTRVQSLFILAALERGGPPSGPDALAMALYREMDDA
jgi:ADP-ribose pyrophosphatase YjhB (NUDIX family)